MQVDHSLHGVPPVSHSHESTFRLWSFLSVVECLVLILEEPDAVVARLRVFGEALVLGTCLLTMVEQWVLLADIGLVNFWQLFVALMPSLIHDVGG